jgi:hypothetical protein
MGKTIDLVKIRSQGQDDPGDGNKDDIVEVFEILFEELISQDMYNQQVDGVRNGP